MSCGKYCSEFSPADMTNVPPSKQCATFATSRFTSASAVSIASATEINMQSIPAAAMSPTVAPASDQTDHGTRPAGAPETDATSAAPRDDRVVGFDFVAGISGIGFALLAHSTRTQRPGGVFGTQRPDDCGSGVGPGHASITAGPPRHGRGTRRRPGRSVSTDRWREAMPGHGNVRCAWKGHFEIVNSPI